METEPTASSFRPIVECRVPTYRRPQLLQRALLSLQQQSCPDWRAIVMDDSPASEGRSVVAALSDERIVWRQNPRQLGATANIDQAFSAQPILEGQYAFVLEDDNAIEPEFIATGLHRLEQGDVDILSFNQQCVILASDGTETRACLLRPDTTNDLWGRERLLLNAFLGVSLPNGGYFWRLCASNNLVVGPGVAESQLQECIRQTLVTPPILLMPHPLSLWSMLPSAQIRRQLVGNRRLAANLNQLSAAIVGSLGPECLSRVADTARGNNLPERVRLILADLSLISPACRRWIVTRPLSALRCLLRFYLYRDPLDKALAPITIRHV